MCQDVCRKKHTKRFLRHPNIKTMGHAGLRGGGIQYDLVLVPLVLNDNTKHILFYGPPRNSVYAKTYGWEVRFLSTSSSWAIWSAWV